MPFITGSLIYQRVRRLAAWYGARSRLAQVLGQLAPPIRSLPRLPYSTTSTPPIGENQVPGSIARR